MRAIAFFWRDGRQETLDLGGYRDLPDVYRVPLPVRMVDYMRYSAEDLRTGPVGPAGVFELHTFRSQDGRTYPVYLQVAGDCYSDLK